MAKVVFTIKPNSIYDDLPEERYHFPRRYLNHTKEAVGDWILYYESRRNGGRQCYVATARLDRIEADPKKADHYYAYVSDYLPFVTLVPAIQGGIYMESSTKKSDGTTNKGQFGRSVRLIPDNEFKAILDSGFKESLGLSREPDGYKVAEAEPEEYDRPIEQKLTSRLFRDPSFSRVVLSAYQNRCAMTGLSIHNNANSYEVEAAHIRPIGYGHKGTDSPRNGLALCQTIHWMFDEGLVSIDDDYRILIANHLVPEKIKNFVNPDQKLIIPDSFEFRPHPQFLRYHRENIFKD